MNDWRSPNDPARGGANEKTWRLMITPQTVDQARQYHGEAISDVSPPTVPPDSGVTMTDAAVRHVEVNSAWEELHRAGGVITAMTGFREALKAVPEQALVEQLLESIDAEMLTVGRLVLDQLTTNGKPESLRPDVGASLAVIEWLISTLERSAGLPEEQLSRMYPVLAAVREAST